MARIAILERADMNTEQARVYDAAKQSSGIVGGPYYAYIRLPKLFEAVKRAGVKAKLTFQAHAHMLRHSAGYKLAGDGHDTRSIQDYLGHKDIRHTVRYTELSPARFKNFWRE